VEQRAVERLHEIGRLNHGGLETNRTILQCAQPWKSGAPARWRVTVVQPFTEPNPAS
jgi:hypothetical protein